MSKCDNKCPRGCTEHRGKRTTCEAIQLEGSFMTLGPRRWVQCQNKATLIIKDEGWKGGHAGQMPLCDDCYLMFVEHHLVPHTLEEVTKS